MSDFAELRVLLDQAENLARTGDLDPQDLQDVMDETIRRLKSVCSGNELPN
jgi:hypothetical protein